MKNISLSFALLIALLASGQPTFAMLKSLGINSEEVSPELVAAKLQETMTARIQEKSPEQTIFAMVKAVGTTNADISPELVATKLQEKAPEETSAPAKPDLQKIALDSIFCVEAKGKTRHNYFNIGEFEQQMDQYHAVLSLEDVQEIQSIIEKQIIRQPHMDLFSKNQELIFVRREVVREYYKRNLEVPGSVDYGMLHTWKTNVFNLANSLFNRDRQSRDTALHQIMHRFNSCAEAGHAHLNRPLTRQISTQNNTKK
jgi:hypothetical protein